MCLYIYPQMQNQTHYKNSIPYSSGSSSWTMLEIHSNDKRRSRYYMYGYKLMMYMHERCGNNYWLDISLKSAIARSKVRKHVVQLIESGRSMLKSRLTITDRHCFDTGQLANAQPTVMHWTTNYKTVLPHFELSTLSTKPVIREGLPSINHRMVSYRLVFAPATLLAIRMCTAQRSPNEQSYRK